MLKNNKMLLVGLLLLSGCASQAITKVPEGMRVAKQKEVENCTFMGDVHGVSMLYGVFAKSAMSEARKQAFEQALALNANTLVWQPFSTEVGATSVHGSAYKCN